ncbi:DEKNAAC101430 [Brettanomyces naardenensis]|uniref:C-22 sterol desaturase ERG5 n=1 Tax=Brettanomyces naardenensis TaxID=13370 RepID=A0A448YHU5_BRENA|nr:DEKNAAC101430 [Brettanomyces naardenensis]
MDNTTSVGFSTLLTDLKQSDFSNALTDLLLIWQATSWWQILLTLLIVAITYDQLAYQIHKGPIAGPRIKFWPFMGPFLESVNPKFEEYLAKWKSGPLSCVSIFHKFVVIASTRDLARKSLQSPVYLKPCVVDVAHKILRPNNWVFLDGKAHVDYRKGLNPLFSKKALEIYIPEQEKVMDRYLEKFIKLSHDGPIIFFHEFREYMCAISLKTFCGDYITDNQIRDIADKYYRVTAALELVNFPIVLPYTKAWYGVKIADQAMNVFAGCAQQAKDRMAAGGTPNCVMDQWVLSMVNSKREDHVGTHIREFSNKEISEAVFTFLFASQDASSSLCCWLFQIVADRPDVQKKIREEQLRVRGGDPYKPVTLDMIDKMEYTNMVVKETLRIRPPVLMVPYLVKKSYPISENYTVPKGAMVIPTLYPALHDPAVYDEPEEFTPERWVKGGKADLAKKNWLVFGAGTHVCLGQTYVMTSFTALIGKALLFTDFKHKVTDQSEQIKVFATIFPQDDLFLQFTRREDPTKIE